MRVSMCQNLLPLSSPLQDLAVVVGIPLHPEEVANPSPLYHEVSQQPAVQQYQSTAERRNFLLACSSCRSSQVAPQQVECREVFAFVNLSE